MAHKRTRLGAWSKRMALVAICTTLGLILVLSLSMLHKGPLVYAQPDGGERSQDIPKKRVGRVAPLVTYVAEINLPDGRSILIHRQAESEGSQNNIYFHRPIFAFIKRVDADHEMLKNLPAIVHGQEETGGITYLEFKVEVSDPRFRQLSKDIIVERDVAIRRENIPLDAIEVRRWPMTQAVVQCRDAVTRELLAEMETGTLEGMGDNWSFSLPFSATNLQTFLSKAEDGGVQFNFNYTYENIIVESAIRAAEARAGLEQAVDRTLSSMSIGPDAPIFQNQYDEIRLQLRGQVVETIRGNPEVLLTLERVDPVLLLDKIFEQQPSVSLEQLERSDPERAKHIAEYLKPQIETVARKIEQEQESKDLEKDTERFTVKVERGGEGKLDLKVFSIGGSAKMNDEHTEELIRELERRMGMKLSYDETSQAYRPSDISIYGRAVAGQTAVLDVLSRAYLEIGVDESYFPGAPVRSDFTTEQLEQLDLELKELLPYSGIRLGMIIPYCGKDLPDGFVWADGRTNWPDESWVPDHLRGRPVPNLNGRVVRGASPGEIVGSPGGSDEISAHDTLSDGAHRHRVPDHAHVLVGMTGSISRGGPKIGNQAYTAKDDNQGWRNDAWLSTNVGRDPQNEGQHRHDLVGNTGGSGQLMTMVGDGAHMHRIEAVPFAPSYVALTHVIRIR